MGVKKFVLYYSLYRRRREKSSSVLAKERYPPNSEKMENKKQLAPEEMKKFYFEFQSVIGVTKHMGGLGATEELIESCRISNGKHVLEIGCGIGATPCYIAKRHGCKVVGVDLSERMINRSRERAKKEGVENRVEFRVADAQGLPFEDATFDAVIGESITAFVEDKQRAASEYVRVAKPGGYVGLNECIWVNPVRSNPAERDAVPAVRTSNGVKAPSPGLTEYMSRMTGAKFPAPDGWKELLEGSGLRDVKMKTYKVKALRQFADEIRGLYLKEILKAWCRFFSLYTKSPACRRFAKEALRMPKNIFDVFRYLGYGIYVGSKKYG